MCLDTQTHLQSSKYAFVNIVYWFIPHFIAVVHSSSCVAEECEYMNAKCFWRVYFTWYTALVVSSLQVPHIGLIEFLFAQSINSYPVCDSYKKWYILCDINLSFVIAYLNHTLNTVVYLYVVQKVISYSKSKV